MAGTDRQAGRAWPAYLLGGRVRTSTVALILAFAVIWWAYESYGPAREEAPDQVPAAEVVPPGFIPDPAYTWVPRTDVQRSPMTTTPTTPTTPTTSPTTTTSPTSPTAPADDADGDETAEPTTATAPTPSPSAATPSPTAATTPDATPATPTP